MGSSISPPRIEELLSPLLASLPAAAVSPQPPTAILPLLSPILRQRVQLLSASDSEPWLPLLCYDSSNAAKLEKVVGHERLEPHPVSGEVEVDWKGEVETRYKRIDEETLQGLAMLRDLQLSVRLVWCVGDELGGGDGWRIGEVSVLDEQDTHWGEDSITSAEAQFTPAAAPIRASNGTNGTHSLGASTPSGEDDDDDYWAQYDDTPAQTPGPQHTTAPPRLQANGNGHSRAEEDIYFSQYSTVQPAMDNNDPDDSEANGIETSLGRDEITRELRQNLYSSMQDSSQVWSSEDTVTPTDYVNVAQPRPGSSASSSGSDTVAKLERTAAVKEMREMSEVAVKQHIGTSVKSLYRLARAVGIERQEFERLVRTELDCLGLMDEDD